MTAQLEALAAAAGLAHLAYFLGMAKAEGDLIVRGDAKADGSRVERADVGPVDPETHDDTALDGSLVFRAARERPTAIKPNRNDGEDD